MLLWLFACSPPPCTSMLDGEGGLVVTYVEHPTGWGQDACEGCHVTDLVHRRECTPGVDLEGVRFDVADGTPCAACHGDNGVNE